MIFLSVNHNLLYTILGTYPPGPFRNNQNSPKKISIFPATLSSAGNLLERPTVVLVKDF